MRRAAYTLFFILTCLLTSCGVSKGHFKLEGRILHINQGELYVYSLDGGTIGMDTIKIQGGRFAYEIPLKEKAILMLVFPNFSQQPIFAQSGKSVEISADASKLKEMKVTGTKDNQLMTSFRQEIENASPPQAKHYAEQFIKDHPTSQVGTYLVQKYFIQDPQPDYTKAMNLTGLMLRAQGKNGTLVRIREKISSLEATQAGRQLPRFKATDMNGGAVTSTTLARSPYAMIIVWATWNDESQQMLRQVNAFRRRSGGKLQVVSISIDASRQDCTNSLKNDTISWPNIWDGQMLENKTLLKLGLTDVPDNLLLKRGRVIARGIKISQINSQLKKLVK
ncbi:MAG: DUF4369 domain-containing protein [Prevotella sp.]|jgi:hypothetical protein|nr:DUF4369 domain-containing protein [Prevotella sp.]